MCKVLVLSNMKQVKSPDKLTNAIASAMSSREDDGFGYAIQGEGGVFGERCLEPNFFKTDFKSKILDLPFVDVEYNRFGVKSKPNGAGIFHGRTSTNDRTLLNTHPIIKNDWTLIHNGVVNNHGPAYQMETTNDTEHMVHYLSTTGISGIEKHITGYYACAAFDPKGQLHIFRDSIATLYVAQIDQINSLVFATTQGLIEEVCKTMKWSHSHIEPMKDNFYIILKDGKTLTCQSIAPRGRTAVENKWSEASLGYQLNEVTTTGFDSKFSETMPYNYSIDKNLSEDEISFLHEVNDLADAAYTFFDYDGNAIKHDEFLEYSTAEQLACVVIRPDGTTVNTVNYESETLWEGLK